MTPSTVFLLAAGALLAATLCIVLFPLWRTPSRKNAHSATQRAIFHDQLAELEQDCQAGLLAEADFLPAKAELQRRLLDEVLPTTPLVSPPGKSLRRWTALALAIFIPLAAGAGYAILGSPQALDPLRTQSKLSAEQINEMLKRLEDKLKAQPEDAKSWLMLARSYKVLGRFADAADAYQRGWTLVASDPGALADYAETLARANSSFGGRPDELIAEALKLDPATPQALYLAGISAQNRQQFSVVIEYWSRLLLQLDPNSDDAKWLTEAIDKARAEIKATEKSAESP